MNGKRSTRETQMKRSPSELALEEFVQENMFNNNNSNNMCSGNTFNNESPISKVDSICDTWTPDDFLYGDYAGYLDFAFNSQGYGRIPETNTQCPHNLTPDSSGVSVTIESQSSTICADSPVSVIPLGRDEKALRGGNGSFGEQSDDEDAEIEAGPCEQSINPLEIKRMRRKKLNKESARRSRRKRQALLAELEQQVERLRIDNSTLFKQLTEAAQQHHDAETNHRVIKSDVEALRAKVKLAEEMVARGSLTCSLNQLLPNHMSSPQTFSNNNLGQIANLSPGITINGEEGPISGITTSQHNSVLGIANTELSTNGIMSDAVSGVTDIWF